MRVNRIRVPVTVIIEMDVETDSPYDASALAIDVIEALTEDSGRRGDGWVPDEDGMITAGDPVSILPLTHGWRWKCAATGRYGVNYGLADEADAALEQQKHGHTVEAFELPCSEPTAPEGA